MNEGYLQEYLWWITERQEIYKRRFMLEEDRPWTDNQYLDAYHFCHAQRELDTGTKFALDTILRQDKSNQGVLLNTIFYRFFNKPETVKMVGGFREPDDFNPEGLVDVLDAYGENNTLFSSAYRVTTQDWAGADTKHANILLGVFRDHLLPNLDDYSRRIFGAGQMHDVFDILTEIPGVGDFLAYEILTDLNYRHLRFSENDFVNIGPGAEEGLERIFDDPDESSLRWLQENQEQLYTKYDIQYPFLKGKQELTLRDLEHSACEVRKYWTLVEPGATSHRKFEPRDHNQDSLENFS
ncbi:MULTISPECIES: nucleotide kinase domain-containing protein [Haloarcula]|uniref:nucleotide kinase domain-containing protein n=1 Tax=Haloarcula TaxID=2237 RepID=UPI0023E8732C|nr:nucleotide kinase domain-containing protein [Halomicroarcula sp. SHR3]